MLEFKTSSGNRYLWDDEIGLFFPSSDTMNAVRNEISKENTISMESVIEIFKKDFDPTEIIFCYKWLKKLEKIRPLNYYSQKYRDINPDDIKSLILNQGISQMILCVTEDCNFRCTFCVYSDNYEYTRNHSMNYMNFSVAKKAIDYFLSLIKDGNKHNPYRMSTLGFYGGEPLLNFELIKKCVEYINDEYTHEKLFFNLTTNGSLLDKEKIKWLIKNNFFIMISLNGPEKEHDRLRVYKDGKGTFKDVMRNISPFINEGYKKISSLPVFDWKSNLFECEKFFNGKNIPYPEMVSAVSYDGGSKYYEQFTKEEYGEFLEQMKKARKHYTEQIDRSKHNKKPSFFDDLFGTTLRAVLFGRDSVNIQSVIPYTRACIPGKRIFVDVNGYYHVCEKVNDTFPIGNVNDGLDFEKINILLNDYFNHMDKCTKCEITRQCDCCFQQFMTDNGFSYSSKVCEEKEAIFKDIFINTLEIAEKFPDFVDSYNIKHQNVKKHWGE